VKGFGDILEACGCANVDFHMWHRMHEHVSRACPAQIATLVSGLTFMESMKIKVRIPVKKSFVEKSPPVLEN
jgi:hypothetical protein